MAGNDDIPIDMLDAKVASAIRRAEKMDGHRYGAASFHNGVKFSPCFVSVSFYPTRRWFVRIGDGERQPLTPELDDRIKPLQL